MQVCTDRDMVTHLWKKTFILAQHRETQEDMGLGTGGFARWLICSCRIQENWMRKLCGTILSLLWALSCPQFHEPVFDMWLFSTVLISPQNQHAAFKINNCSMSVLTTNFYICCGGSYMTYASVKTHRTLNLIG